MPAFSFIFNKLRVEIPAKKLSLSVDSSVSLQYCSGNAQTMKTRQLLDLLCSGKPWVTRGPGYRIDFLFVLGKQQDGKPATEKMIENFAASVRGAPLWSQVSLEAKIELPDSDTSDDLRSSFSIILRHPPFHGTPAHSSTRMSSAPPDVQIPTDVPCFQLRRIKIVMTFDFGKAYRNSSSLLPDMAANSAEDSIEKKCDTVGESINLTNYLLLPQAGLNSSQIARSTSSLYLNTLLCQDHEMLDGSTLLYDNNVATPLLTIHSSTKSLPTLRFSQNSQEEAVEDAPTQCGMTSVSSELSCASEMAHLAFRKLVSGRQSKSQPGIKATLRQPTLTLSRLAPSLFSPGFAEAVSQRSQFIPIISHALSVSLLRNAQSPGLQRKLLFLVSNPAKPPDSNVILEPVDDIHDRSDFASNSRSRHLSRVVEGRLWAMMQRSLYRPPSVSCILPTEDVDPGGHGALTVEVVEASISGLGGAESVMGESLSFMGHGLDLFDDDFEDLFEDMLDEGEREKFMALFSDSTYEQRIDDDFEDLLEDEPPDTPDQTIYAGAEACEMEFNIAADDGIRYWKTEQNRDLLDEHYFDHRKISDIENRDMLI